MFNSAKLCRMDLPNPQKTQDARCRTINKQDYSTQAVWNDVLANQIHNDFTTNGLFVQLCASCLLNCVCLIVWVLAVPVAGTTAVACNFCPCTPTCSSALLCAPAFLLPTRTLPNHLLMCLLQSDLWMSFWQKGI